MQELIFLIIGFIMIIKASDILVDSSVSIASKLKVPKMLIALTIVAFGTCAPEVAISFNSIFSDNATMAVGNAVGSCIVNIFLIIGIAALIKPIKVKNNTIKKELPILFLITTSFSALMLDSIFNKNHNNVFSRGDAIVLIALFFMFIAYIIQLYKGRNKDELEDSVSVKYKNIYMAITLLVLSIIMLCMSSDVIVNNAIILAEKIGISEKIITMTAIVIGTSLPELMLTISSAKKGEFDMTLGNIIGTNIFNICIVLGLPIVISGNIVLNNFTIVDIFILFLSSLILFIFSKSEKTISKREGIIMLLIFIMYYVYLFI